MDFSKYKNRLIEYLSIKGFKQIREGDANTCINPQHADKNPSCLINKDHFNCLSGACAINGDIYDAVELLEGITDKKEQFQFLQKVFDGYVPEQTTKQVTAQEKETFVPDGVACLQFEEYLANHTKRSQEVKNFLKLRAINASHREKLSYPKELLSKLEQHFYYWPGLKIAKQEIDPQILRKVGIPFEKKGTDFSSWDPSGVILKLGVGYKLHFYRENICEKRGSKSCQTFPMPKGIEKLSDLIFVEGEMDAVVLRSYGIENVFAIGGTNGLTEPKIKKYLLTEHLKSITLLFDNDTAGKKMSGAVPLTADDKIRKNVPQKLRSSSYTGSIKVAVLDDFKDPDMAILYENYNIIQKALENASEWQDTPLSKEKKQKETLTKGTLTPKEIRAILSRIKIADVDPKDMQEMISATINSAESKHEFEVKEALRKWGASENFLSQNHKTEPSFLFYMAEKHELSYHYRSKIQNATISEKDIEKFLNHSEKPLTNIRYENYFDTKDFDTFIYKRGERAAANMIAKILEGKLIFIESEKKYYFFNGLIWQRESDISGIAYNILFCLLNEYKKRHDKERAGAKEDKSLIKAIYIALAKIEEYRYCTTVMKAVAEKQNIFRDQITFDGPQIQESLTLLDGVIDFSGKTIVYRDAFAHEYRKKQLPYTLDEVKNGTTPENFINFMKGNFKNDDTRETLMYYLSLIPSRRAQYKVGGIFVGTAHTGKTTTMKIFAEIYKDMTTPIPREMIMSQGRFSYSSGPNPYMARLEGAGAGISDETKRNDTLNGALWKQLTGGGMLTARGMYAMPRDFMPTAQIVILTNYSPKFDGKDQATIDRMVVIPFTIQHKKGEKGTMEEDELLDKLRPEFPAVVKLFAEYYIGLKKDHKSKIPLSKECEEYKNDYIENQETDLDRFVNDNIQFIKGENFFEKLKDVYHRFCVYYDIELDEMGKPKDKEALSQSKFTRFLKSDYNEIRIKQKKINGEVIQVILNMKLKDTGITKPKEQTMQIEPAVNYYEPSHNEPPDEDPFGGNYNG